MKLLQIIIGTLSFLSLFAFTFLDENKDKFIGEFGQREFCEIKLNADNTFTYFDRTIKNNIETKGIWEVIDEELILKTNEKSKIIKKWKLTNNGSCLKSRKGLAFYTLCKKCD